MAAVMERLRGIEYVADRLYFLLHHSGRIAGQKSKTDRITDLITERAVSSEPPPDMATPPPMLRQAPRKNSQPPREAPDAGQTPTTIVSAPLLKLDEDEDDEGSLSEAAASEIIA